VRRFWLQQQEQTLFLASIEDNTPWRSTQASITTLSRDVESASTNNNRGRSKPRNQTSREKKISLYTAEDGLLLHRGTLGEL
jgi:hypothetical protein